MIAEEVGWTTITRRPIQLGRLPSVTKFSNSPTLKKKMLSLRPPPHAETPQLPTTASASLLHACTRPRLGFGSHRAAASALSAVTADASCHALCRDASVGAPSPRASTRWPDGGGHLVLAFAASAVAISASFVFFSVIRSMLNCKRAAESLEKSFDSMREKLPETMASVRLVGREVSELSVDLSDLSQDLRKVFRSSISIVDTADAQLHQLSASAPKGTAHRGANGKKTAAEPLLARTVRELRELVADIRSGYGAASSVASLFLWASSFGPKRPKNH